MPTRSLRLSMAAVSLAAMSLATPSSADPSAFAQNIWPNINYLDQSSRLAMRKSSDGRLRAFARDEAGEQTAASNAIVAWMDSVAANGAGEGRASRPAPSGNLMSMPFRAAANITSQMADEIDGMQTGRSVAIDDETTVHPPAMRPVTLPTSTANLDHLSSLSGRQFDAFYKSSQIDALLQLSTIYATYIQDGRDPGLRNLAVRELPKVNARIATIRAMR